MERYKNLVMAEEEKKMIEEMEYMQAEIDNLKDIVVDLEGELADKEGVANPPIDVEWETLLRKVEQWGKLLENQESRILQLKFQVRKLGNFNEKLTAQLHCNIDRGEEIKSLGSLGLEAADDELEISPPVEEQTGNKVA
jgi:hypothetical protein